MPSDLLTLRGSDLRGQLHEEELCKPSAHCPASKPSAPMMQDEDFVRFQLKLSKIHAELLKVQQLVEAIVPCLETTTITTTARTSRAIVMANCPQNHGLYEFCTNTSSFVCDSCQSAQCLEAFMYGCRICNFDLCTRCCEPGAAANATLRADRPHGRCPSGHGLVPTRWEMERKCDDCKNRQRTRRLVLSCVLCEYDKCVRCGGMEMPNFYQTLGFMGPTHDVTELDIKRRAFTLSIDYRKQCVRNPDNQGAQTEALARYEEAANALVVLCEHREEYDLALARATDTFDALEWKAPEKSEDDFFQHVLFPPFSKAYFKEAGGEEASFVRGAYVATIGLVWAPVACTSYGVVKLGFGLAEGTGVVLSSCAHGVNLVTSGVGELYRSSTSSFSSAERDGAKGKKSASRRIYTADSARRWSRPVQDAKLPPWKRIRRGVIQPVTGLVKGVLIVGVSAVGITVGIAGASCYGMAQSVRFGVREMRDAAKQGSRRRSNNSNKA